MIDIVVGMKTDLEMLKTSFGNAIKVGPIEEIDPKKGYRIKLADTKDGPYLSPWYPHPESGGQTKSWVPLSKGQIVAVMHPSGDPRQGVLMRAGFSDEKNPAPSDDMSANVLEGLGIKITVKDGTLTLEGNLLVKGNADFNDGYVRADGHAIDETHKHKDVVSGGDVSGVPV
ncbi:MAG: phage baseplate assembly protein V [Nitratireductor sp.]|nr:phage baseplate assembly protein V [Nitratireductor sp.]